MMRKPIAVHYYGSTDPKAETMLLLHGLTEAGTTWPDLVKHWEDTYRIIAPDLRGHGDSPRFHKNELSNSAEIMISDVLSLLDEMKSPVILIGHSLGGNLALAAALARPEKVAKLILEDPAAPMEDSRDEAVKHNEVFLDSMKTKAKRSAQINRMLKESNWSQAEIEAWAASKPRVDRRYIREGMQLVDIPWEESFQALTVPTLLVLPDPAPMAPDPRMLTNPLIYWAFIPEAGHCVRRDQAEKFFTVIEEFLEENK